jgi:hypothetical protein
MSYVFNEGINLKTDDFDFMIMKPDDKLKIFHFNDEQGKKYFRRIIGLQ